MRVSDVSCPICGAPAEVRSFGGVGFVAHCSECFDCDPESEQFRILQGIGETPSAAVEHWLADAREYCAVDEIPSVRINYTLNHLFRDLHLQVIDEAERQESWRERLGFDRSLNIIAKEWAPC